MPLIKPKLFTTLKNYNKQQYIADAIAGVIVGIVALPFAIAFGSTLRIMTEKGIITATLAGIEFHL